MLQRPLSVSEADLTPASREDGSVRRSCEQLRAPGPVQGRLR